MTGLATDADFSSAYEANAHRVRGYLAGRLGDAGQPRHLAEDLTAETFVRAWRNRHRYADDNKLFSWLMTIARNVLVDYLRSPKVRAADLEDSEQVTCDLADADFAAVDADMLFTSLTDGMPERWIQAARLQLDGYRAEDIAVEMGVRAGNARALCFRAWHRARTNYLATPD